MYIPNSNLFDIDILEKIIVDNTILIGDLNCKNKKWGSKNINNGGRKLKESCYELGLEIPNIPKNYKKNDGSLDVIDNDKIV